MKKAYRSPDCHMLIVAPTDPDIMTLSPVLTDQLTFESEGKGDNWDW